jgi:hypothetical protein
MNWHKSYGFLLLLVLIFTSCQHPPEIDGNELIHDNSSKVWLMSEHWVNSENQIPSKREDLIFLVLFKDGTCRSGIMAYFDDPANAFEGSYEVDHTAGIFRITWNQQQPISYQLVELNEQRLVLQDESGDAKMIFVPYFKPSAAKIEVK